VYLWKQKETFKSLPESTIWNATIAYKPTFGLFFEELEWTESPVGSIICAAFGIQGIPRTYVQNSIIAVINDMQDLGAISFL